MKTVQHSQEPINILVGKDRAKGLFVVLIDHQQTAPRVSIGSAWVGTDRRYNRRFLLRVVELGYIDDFDLKMAVSSIRANPTQPFDDRSLEY